MESSAELEASTAPRSGRLSLRVISSVAMVLLVGCGVLAALSPEAASPPNAADTDLAATTELAAAPETELFYGYGGIGYGAGGGFMTGALTGAMMASMMYSPYYYGGYAYYYEGEQPECDPAQSGSAITFLSSTFSAVSGNGRPSPRDRNHTSSSGSGSPSGSGGSTIRMEQACARMCTNQCSPEITVDHQKHKWTCECNGALSRYSFSFAAAAALAIALMYQ